MKNNTSAIRILSVMFGFFIMGFVDIIGISTNYVKNDFSHLTDSVVNLISLSCFFWFLVLSVPTGMLMNKIGRKKTVLISFAFHVLAMCLPLAAYDFTTVLIMFGLIGIGNTLLQVSLNPLVADVVNSDKLTGTLTLGQFVKAVSSFIGPILAASVVGSTLGWRMIFPIYAALSLLAFIWLSLTPIEDRRSEKSNISIKNTLELFKDKYIVAFFIGILVLVGVDVGMNMTFPKLLMEKSGLSVEDAGMGNSIYFLSRTVGAFLGGILLMKSSESKFFIYSVWIALAGLVLLCINANLWATLACVAVFGLGYANLFSIIFSLALKRIPEKANEISALLIVGVSGGAILPPILGVVTDAFKTQVSAIILIAAIWCYLLWLISIVRKTSK
ncbi:MFS transporter [Dysgonomonas sp. UBA7710]|jgi:fucose permease|uniref:MFS transporter n=2 Tax=unclassified Dysgonomonas TaxID=2630389 RepID=UPI0039C8565B